MKRQKPGKKAVVWEMPKPGKAAPKEKTDPKDHDLWGRPTKYKPEFAQQIIEYFDRPLTEMRVVKTITKADGSKEDVKASFPCHLPFLTGFSEKIGVARYTLLRWSKQKDDKPEFCAAYARARKIQEQIMNQNAAEGLYNPAYTKFLAQNITDMREKKSLDIDHTTKGKSIKSEKKIDLSRFSDKELKLFQILNAKAVIQDSESDDGSEADD